MKGSNQAAHGETNMTLDLTATADALTAAGISFRWFRGDRATRLYVDYSGVGTSSERRSCERNGGVYVDAGGVRNPQDNYGTGAWGTLTAQIEACIVRA